MTEEITSNPELTTGAFLEEPVFASEPSEDFTVGLAKEATPVEVKKEPDPIVEKKFTATLEANYTSPAEIGDDDICVNMPSRLTSETEAALSNTPNVELLDDTASAKWGRVLGNGLELNTFKEVFVPTLEDQTADFRQRIESNGRTLFAQEPRMKSTENENLKGERGAIRLMSYLGLGTIFQAPLWHTGIWITFKAPTESEIVELDRVLMADKIQFGRYSYGLAFSNVTAYTLDRLTTFALEHVYETSIKSSTELSISWLRGLISTQDAPALLWGLVCAMYPSGFKYRRSCVNNPEKCNHVTEALLNVSLLQWTNTNSLTEWQKSHMANRRAGSMSEEDVKRYKSEMLRTQPRKIYINKQSDRPMGITLRTPSLADYIDSGYRWINNIVDLVDKSLGKDVAISDRNKFITRHGKATTMRQYSHWIQEIEFGSNVTDAPASIEHDLNLLSSDDIIREEFIAGVVDYINASTMSVIGIPAYDCPKCSAPQEIGLTLPKLVNVIPLDVNSLFFVLLGQRIQKIEER